MHLIIFKVAMCSSSQIVHCSKTKEQIKKGVIPDFCNITENNFVLQSRGVLK